MSDSMRVRLFASTAIALGLSWGCSDSSSPLDQTLVTGATPVRGTERLAWAQTGDVSRLRFRLYVDDQPVDLTAATCDAATPAECRSPLPSLTAGVHSLALVNVQISSGAESARTASISVQKVSASSSLAATLPRVASQAGSVRLETVLSIANAEYSADIVASDIDESAQLASLPDGRLLIADGDKHVLVLRPGASEGAEDALDAIETLSPPPIGSIAVTSHPQFRDNHFVYVSFLASGHHERTIFRVVRTREIGGTLGEPATIFEAPVMTNGAVDDAAGIRRAAIMGAPRMAFGPDRLLYISLPSDLEFESEPAASVPVASMARLTDEGRLPPGGSLRGITSHPLGFTWNPESGAMWAIFVGPAETTVARSLADGSFEPTAGGSPLPQMRRVRGLGGDALVLQPGGLEWAGFPVRKNRTEGATMWSARLATPVALEPQADRVGDVVAGNDGTFFVVMKGAQPLGTTDANRGAVVVRLTPIVAPAARRPPS